MSDHKESEPMQMILDFDKEKGPVTMGLTSSYTWRHDPKHILFSLSRYKFCAKMLSGKKSVYEAGCGDGFGVPILMQEVDNYLGVDIEPSLVDQCIELYSDWDNVEFSRMDLTKESPGKLFDACISLDVIEHIDPNHESFFMERLCGNLNDDAICFIGTPNIDADMHASKISKIGHVNLKSQATLKKLMDGFFENVFVFSMNDEVVHTGFSPMAHYLMAVGVGKIR